MTRFSRVTFNAAHKYLGLTAEVLRTEKAINDIACHPLPPTFYEGGGMQQLRQRFDGVGGQDFSPAQSKLGDEYYNLSPTVVSPKTRLSSKNVSTTSSMKLPRGFQFPLSRSHSMRHLVLQAGDLHSSTTSGEAYKPLGRSFSISSVPSPSHREFPDDSEPPEYFHFDGVDFDLRQEVMNCIAVSIGLLQPPMSDDTSVEASPSFPATDGGQVSRSGGNLLESPFGSLSLLDIGDDLSSATGRSSSVTANGHMIGLDNEVEILFFSSGSYLATAGERDIGVFVSHLQKLELRSL
jgi:lysophospholipid hydrolase